MKKIILIALTIKICFSCNIEYKESSPWIISTDEIAELQLISSYVFNINNVDLDGRSKVFRILDEEKLREDTILYVLNKDNLYEQNSSDYLLYVKFCVRDVAAKFDITSYKTSVILDIYPINGDSTKFEIGKFKNIDGKITYGWSGNSTMASLDFPTDLQKIRDNFESYNCYYFGEYEGANEKAHMMLDYSNSFGVKYDIEKQVTEGLTEFMKVLNRYNSENHVE